MIRSDIVSMSPSVAAAELDHLCSAAERGSPPARTVLAALVPFLLEEGAGKSWEKLRKEAENGAHLALCRLLRGARVATPAEPSTGTVLTTPAGRPLTLGERRALARKPTRAVLEKLLADPHPMVTRVLLGNPRLTEDDVLRICTRRPGAPLVLLEVGRNPDWVQRSRVRMAIVLNPYAPPELSVPLVPLLVRPELQEVVNAADLQPLVRATAVELLAKRPPIPAISMGPLGAH